jgi:APA family basic amino acid/polyamine antiporter
LSGISSERESDLMRNVTTAPSHSPRPVLGFWSLFALGVNGIVGVGIFFVPSRVAELVPGVFGSAVYALTALALLPIAATYALLGSRFVEDGGPYLWARAAFGPTLAFAVGWIAYVSAAFSTAAVVSSLGQHLVFQGGGVGSWAARFAASSMTVALGLVVGLGLRPTAVVWNTLTVSKLLPLFALVGCALWWGLTRRAIALPPVSASEPENLWRAMLLVVFATQGFEIVVVPAGQVRGALRAVPLATVVSLVSAALLYVAIHAASVSAPVDLAHSPSPLVAAAQFYGGRVLGQIVGIGATVSALGIAFGMMAMTPRYLAPLGRPEWLGQAVSRLDRRAVPRRALGITTIIVLTLVLSGNLRTLFVLSSVAVLVQYGVSVMALVVLAWRRERGLCFWHIWPAPLGLAAIALLVSAASSTELIVAAGAVVLGGLVVWGRRFLRRQSQ